MDPGKLIPYRGDVKVWKHNFEKEAAGKRLKKKKGMNLLEPLTGGAESKVVLVTPTAQATEQAKSDLKRMKKRKAPPMKRKTKRRKKGAAPLKRRKRT